MDKSNRQGVLECRQDLWQLAGLVKNELKEHQQDNVDWEKIRRWAVNADAIQLRLLLLLGR